MNLMNLKFRLFDLILKFQLLLMNLKLLKNLKFHLFGLLLKCLLHQKYLMYHLNRLNLMFVKHH